MEQFGVGYDRREDNPDLLFTPQEVADTPSRVEGMTASQERHERFTACKLAREIVRRLLIGEGNPTNSKDAEQHREWSERAQALACYYLQLYFMFNAIDDGSQVPQKRQFPAESPQVVALAAVLLACKVSERPQRMKELVRAHANVRAMEGSAELAEEESRELQRRVPAVEFDLLRIVKFDFDLAMPHDMIEKLVHTEGGDFVDRYKSLGYTKLQTKELDNFRSKLLRNARNFVNDSFLGVCPLLFPPRTVAAGALSLAMRHLDRGSKNEHIQESLQAIDPLLMINDVKKSQDELLNVFRTSQEIKRMTPANGKPPQAPAVAGNAAKTCTQVPKAGAKQDQGQLTPEKPATVSVQASLVPAVPKDAAVAVVQVSVVGSFPVTAAFPNGSAVNGPIRNTSKISEMRAHPYAPQHVQPALA